MPVFDRADVIRAYALRYLPEAVPSCKGRILLEVSPTVGPLPAPPPCTALYDAMSILPYRLVMLLGCRLLLSANLFLLRRSGVGCFFCDRFCILCGCCRRCVGLSWDVRCWRQRLCLCVHRFCKACVFWEDGLGCGSFDLFFACPRKNACHRRQGIYVIRYNREAIALRSSVW